MSQSRYVLAALTSSEYFRNAHSQKSEAKKTFGALDLELFEPILEPTWFFATRSAITLINIKN